MPRILHSCISYLNCRKPKTEIKSWKMMNGGGYLAYRGTGIKITADFS